MPPHSLPLVTVIGTSLLWVGWFGFNAGSELAADGTAGLAFLTTQHRDQRRPMLTWCGPSSSGCTSGKPTVARRGDRRRCGARRRSRRPAPS